QSAAEIAASLRICYEAEATVIPQGSGTAMSIGNPPRRADVVIVLSKFNRLIEHDAANLTASVQSGATLSAVQAALRGQKQFVPFDPPFANRATFGAIVAANLNGPRRNGYGSVRDLVIGAKVTLASGEEIKAGGKVVKNVAGYDLCKLFVGSLGTLGIITEITFRVTPILESSAALVAVGELTQAERFSAALLGSALLPVGVYLFHEHDRKDWSVAVGWEGFEDTVARQLRESAVLASDAGLENAILRDEEQSDLWLQLSDLPLAGERVVYRVTLPRAAVFDFLKAAQHGPPLKIAADAALGTIWLVCAAKSASLELFPRLTEWARARRGHAVIFAAPAELKLAVDVWGPSPSTLSLMREVKRQFDPKGLLNPGRFVGAI
ncbi:MAG TPA: FAD-binding oxidoreductase, partial [Terriglobales bacterium]|nr:FAD-binding oxidoreductase [Terriglobales bacterium]